MPWHGPRAPGERPTLGWIVADWIRENCVIPDREFAGHPFELNDDQLEFLLAFYELHEDAVDRQMFQGEWRPDIRPNRAWIYDRGGQLVAPQKWGKSPFAAAMVLAEAYGPVLFNGWKDDGEPTGRPWKTPKIQITAHSEDQTKNTWGALLPMITLGKLEHEIPDTGVTRINLPNGGWIEPATSASKSRLGQPITFVVQDETHSWVQTDGGWKLADTQRRNVAGMGGRFLDTSNAWDPAEESVAQRTFEKETGVCKLMVRGGSGGVRNHAERMRVLKKLYASSWWADLESISSDIDSLLEKGEYAQAERYFLNRIVPAEDRAFDPRRWRELARPDTHIPDGELITVGVDGARYFDALAIVATDVKTGFQWPLGIWQRPEGAADDYEHPLDEVDAVMTDAYNRFRVWRIYIDPGSQYANISNLVDMWSGRWGEKQVFPWLMSRPKITAFMVREYVSAVMTGDVTHDGNDVFARHISNARRKMVNAYDDDGRKMYVLSKDAPGSPNKIDAAAAAALSWAARGDAIKSGAVALGPYDDPAQKCGACGHLRRHHVPACRGRPSGHCNQFIEPVLE
jgi:hypothetical protein